MRAEKAAGSSARMEAPSREERASRQQSISAISPRSIARSSARMAFSLPSIVLPLPVSLTFNRPIVRSLRYAAAQRDVTGLRQNFAPRFPLQSPGSPGAAAHSASAGPHPAAQEARRSPPCFFLQIAQGIEPSFFIIQAGEHRLQIERRVDPAVERFPKLRTGVGRIGYQLLERGIQRHLPERFPPLFFDQVFGALKQEAARIGMLCEQLPLPAG